MNTNLTLNIKDFRVLNLHGLAGMIGSYIPEETLYIRRSKTLSV